jgi:hypothetical protein
MAQFESKVPDLLRDHLPGFLPPGRVAAPPVGVLLVVFIGGYRLKSAAMQIQLDHIAGGKRLLWQIGEEEFVDDPCARDPNRTFLFARRMRCDDHTAQHAFRPHRDRLAIIEAAHHLTFRALLELIWGQMQTRLDQRMIKGGVLLASGHERETSQISEYGSGPVLSIESQERAGLWQLVCSEIPINGRQALSQFLSVAPIAPVAKTAESTFNCGPG